MQGVRVVARGGARGHERQTEEQGCAANSHAVSLAYLVAANPGAEEK
jgi:hypothetical protein